MSYKSILSSVFEYADYDETTQTLDLAFKDGKTGEPGTTGKIVRYKNISSKIFSLFMKDNEFGRNYNQYIRGKYSWEIIGKTQSS